MIFYIMFKSQLYFIKVFQIVGMSQHRSFHTTASMNMNSLTVPILRCLTCQKI